MVAWLKKRWRRLAALTAAGVLLWLGLSALVAWNFTGRASGPWPEPAPQPPGMTVEDRRLETVDHQTLGAWLARGERGKPCVLLLHGNGASRGQMLSVMRGLAERRLTALALTFRAHGDSSGTHNDIGWSARHDVVAGVRSLQQECPGQPIYVVGRSLGAAAAIFAARELGHDVAGYFLEQPYKDLKSAAWNRLENHLPPVLDHAAYLGLLLWGPWALGVDPAQVSPYEHIAEIPPDVPIVLATGSADRHARPEDVVALYGRVQSHARLVIFEGAVHEGLDSRDPQLYWSALDELLQRSGGEVRRPKH
jgi:uncharacterized protein